MEDNYPVVVDSSLTINKSVKIINWRSDLLNDLIIVVYSVYDPYACTSNRT